LAERKKEFLGIGVPGVIGTGIVIGAAVAVGIPQAILRFATELVRAALR